MISRRLDQGRFLGELAEALRHQPDASAMRRWTLQSLGRLFPYDSAISLGTPDLAARPAMVNKQEFLPLLAMMSREAKRFAPGFVKNGLALAADGVYLDTDLYTAHERLNLPFYAEIVRPQRITNQLAASIRFRGHSLGVIYLCRNGRTGRFRSRDVEALKTILPALGLAHAALAWTPPRHANERVSPREMQIARLVARGMRNIEIAALFGTSPSTVRNQLHLLFEKLDLTSRSELATWVTRDHDES